MEALLITNIATWVLLWISVAPKHHWSMLWFQTVIVFQVDKQLVGLQLSATRWLVVQQHFICLMLWWWTRRALCRMSWNPFKNQCCIKHILQPRQRWKVSQWASAFPRFLLCQQFSIWKWMGLVMLHNPHLMKMMSLKIIQSEWDCLKKQCGSDFLLFFNLFLVAAWISEF